METLMQMRNALLKKLEQKRKLGICSTGIRKGDLIGIRKGHRRDSLKKRKKFCERRMNDKISHFLKKHNNNQKLTSLFKQRKKHNGQRDCSKNVSKGVQSDQLHSKGKKTESLKRKRKIKTKSNEVVRDEASRLQRRAKYLLVKLKLDQSLIDAYTGEGWKGQSREKIRPEKELERAKKQILNCKLGIRDVVQQLESLASVGKIDDSFISSDGSVHHEHIFCKKCETQEVSEDNDIILCDGTCNCAFHQKCIDPPMATKDIPPEGEGWLCKYCDCKTDLLEAINAHLGTQFSDECKWQDIFKEEALLSDSRTTEFNHEEKWPGDESDDDDYNPDREEIYNARDDDGGPHEENSASSSSCSLESEVYWESGLGNESNEISSNSRHLHQSCVTDLSDNELISGLRKRSTVDYQKLYDEMFAKDVNKNENDVCSEDEDWDPQKRRRRKKESDAATTLMTLCVSEVKPSNSRNQEVVKNQPPDKNAVKRPSRIPDDILQKLRQAFAENELPSKKVKKEISDDVGLEFRKVNKWFKNARYSALKNQKIRENDKQKEGHLKCTASNKSDVNVEPIVSNSPSPVPIHKKLLKKVSWDDNLATLISSAKKKRLQKTSLCNDKASMELSDDVSLKKHLLKLKAKNRQENKGNHDTEHSQVTLTAEMQLEQVCEIEAKLFTMKQVLCTFQKPVSVNLTELDIDEKHVAYVPFAVVKEKL